MPGNESLTPYVVRMLWQIGAASDDRKDRLFALSDEFKRSLAIEDVPVHFLGVWDTVSSVGWIGSPVALPHSRINPSVRHARHAVAIDEKRAFFRTNLLAAPEGQDLRQVWFPGVHCDVGGGYAEAESGMSKYALEWMAGEARGLGMLVDDERLEILLGRREAPPDRFGRRRIYAVPSPDARLHKSLSLPWRIAEFVPKRYFDRTTQRKTWRMNLFRRRTWEAAPVVADVAWDIPGYADRLPKDARKLSEAWPG
jgi:uncharacterized protein (DUF2235 family)